MVAPLPDDEIERLRSLRMHNLLDSDPEVAFDLVTRLASLIFGVPISLISLVDAHRQWFKARVGLDDQETEREVSFCSHAILEANGPFVVEDARQDPRFRNNPYVTNKPWIRLYAGHPIYGIDGLALGTVCIISPSPRSLDAHEREILSGFAQLTEELIRHRHVEMQLDEIRDQRNLQLRALAHDIASPLSALNLRLAALDATTDEKARSLGKAMGRTVAGLERMVRHLSLGIHGVGMVEEMDLAPVRLRDIVDEALAANLSMANQKGVEIEIAGDGDTVVVADGASTRRVFHNLISNAMKHGTRRIEVGWEVQDGLVTCSVSDDGEGFSQELGSRLFAPYVQEHEDVGFQTFGLGLYICRTLIESQGGRMHATSPGPGQGATFYFTMATPLRTIREMSREPSPRAA